MSFDFVDTVAEIITGEAEVLGVIGMTTVAGCIRSQLDAGWSQERILDTWAARKPATSLAYTLATKVTPGNIAGNGYLCCLSLADTIRLRCGNGEMVIALKGTPYELHLWREWPVRKHE